jgi:hypothetical protein
MSEPVVSLDEKNDGWWISLLLRSAVLFSVTGLYGLLLTGNWGLWWSGLFVPGSASRQDLLLPSRLAAPYWRPVDAALQWFAVHPLGRLIHPGGFSALFWGLAANFLGYVPLGLLWTIFDRRKRVNAVLSEIVYLAVRYQLATGMFLYGSAKVIGRQGPPQPAPLEWFRPLGEISTGEIMWTWLGYSTIFHFFAGINETLGAILLLFRRTTLLGAFLILPVMSFVAALDTTFHVGPAGYALYCAAFALYLIAREWRRFAGAFLLGNPTVPTPQKDVWASRRLVLAGRGVWVVLIAYSLWSYPLSNLRERVDIGGRHSPLRGAYRVERFVSDGRVLPEEAADPARWREVSISWFGDYMRIRRMDDSELLWSADPGDPYPFLVATGHGYRYGDSGRLLAKTAGIEEQLRFKELPNYASPHTAALFPLGPVLNNPGWMSHYTRGEFFTVNLIRDGSDRLSMQGRIDGADISADLVRIPNDDFEFFKTRGGVP